MLEQDLNLLLYEEGEVLVLGLFLKLNLIKLIEKYEYTLFNIYFLIKDLIF